MHPARLALVHKVTQSERQLLPDDLEERVADAGLYVPCAAAPAMRNVAPYVDDVASAVDSQRDVEQSNFGDAYEGRHALVRPHAQRAS